MSDEIRIQITKEDIEAAGSAEREAMPWLDPDAQTTSKAPVDIVLLIDTSGSMEVTDYPPSRLAAAKEAARMFTRRKVVQNYKDRVAVIGFGGSAQVVHALSSDLDKVAVTIDRLAITHTGTMIGAALRLAQQELQRAGGKRQAIVLLSDGGDEFDSSRPLEIVKGFQGIKVFAIGIGTPKGGHMSFMNKTVRLNEDLLRAIAKATGGEYLYAPDVVRLQQIYTQLADY